MISKKASISFLLIIALFWVSSGLAQVKNSPLEKISDREHRNLTEITITADPFNPSLLEHSRPVTVLEKKDIVKKAEPTIGETIGKELGVSSSYFGPGASRPVIRGNAGERVRVLQNGIGTLDISNTSEDHAVSSNPLSAEAIEILRGPETLLFGSSAIGGVVNVTDNSIPERNIEKAITGAIDYRQGSADDELSGAAKLEGQVGGFNWHVDGFHQDTDDIEIPGKAESAALRAQETEEGEAHEEDQVEGILASSDTRNKGITAGGSHVWERGFLGASINLYSSNYGVPGHVHEEEHEHEELVAAEEEGVAIDLEQVRADLRGRVDEVGKFIKSVKYKLGGSSYQHKELESGAVGTRFENDAFEARTELTHAAIGEFEGVIGLQVQASDFSALGEEAFLPATETVSPALFVFEELPLNDFWKLQVGARQEFVSYDAEGFSSDEFYPNGFSTGVVWDPTGQNDYSLGLSAALSERAPAATELYADGAHIARQIFERGNTALDNEQSRGLDLTMKKNAGFVTGTLNLFVQDDDDYINLSATENRAENLRVFEYEGIEALFWGFEAETVFHLHEPLELWAHDLDFRLQVDSVRAENRSVDDELPRIPPLRTIVGLDYEYREMWGASIEGVFVEEQDRLADFELPTDSYQLLNTSLTYNFPVENAYHLALYVKGTNLTDEEARIHSSFLKDLAPLRGRSFLLGLQGIF